MPRFALAAALVVASITGVANSELAPVSAWAESTADITDNAKSAAAHATTVNTANAAQTAAAAVAASAAAAATSAAESADATGATGDNEGDNEGDNDDGDNSADGAEPKDPKRLEFGILPALNFDSDLGLGFGAIGTLARFYPGYRPYRWRLEFLLYATVKSSPDGGTELPYHDDYIILDQPGLLDGQLRVRTRVGFQRFSTAGYYGLGNASQDIDNDDGRYYQYEITNPHLTSYGRFALFDRSTDTRAQRLEAFAGLGFSYNIMNLYDGSLLAQQVAEIEQGTPDGQALDPLLNGTEDHALLVLSAGLLYDTRDHEYKPSRGTFSELSLRGSPGIDDGLSYAAVTLSTRWFQSLVGQKLVLAVRGISDFMFGTVPVYELPRVGGFVTESAPGGSTSVRGVALNRFHGKIKLIGNVELRTELLPFRVAGQRFNLGLITFVDAGRVWADYEDVEVAGAALDDDFPNVAVGIGAGIRLRWGETFIVRIDPGYSVTEETFGLYININHIF